MSSNKKYQIFISSTYEDLKEARRKVIETILRNEQFPVGMEMFNAADESQWAVIQKTIDTSDYYILIVGFRYGSQAEDGISYTEKEYDYTVSKGIPILTFIQKDNGNYDLQDSIKDFRKKVSSCKMVDFWDNSDELAGFVSTALNKAIRDIPRTGWIRADSNLSKEETETPDQQTVLIDFDFDDELNDTDYLILKASCEIAIKESNDNVSIPALAEQFPQLKEQEVYDSLEMLEKQNFIEISREIPKPTNFKILAGGFERFFIKHNHEEYQKNTLAIVKEIQSGNKENKTIAEKLNLPILIVESILDILVSQEMIQTASALGGKTWVTKTEPGFRRTFQKLASEQEISKKMKELFDFYFKEEIAAIKKAEEAVACTMSTRGLFKGGMHAKEMCKIYPEHIELYLVKCIDHFNQSSNRGKVDFVVNYFDSKKEEYIKFIDEWVPGRLSYILGSNHNRNLLPRFMNEIRDSIEHNYQKNVLTLETG